MRKRPYMVIVAVLACSYVSGPYLAGSFRMGDRLGPLIYPEVVHQALYIIGHESRYNEKPRIPLDSWMYDRPVFYWLSRRLKSSEKRKAYIERARQNGSPALERLIKMNEDIERGHEAQGKRNDAA